MIKYYIKRFLKNAIIFVILQIGFLEISETHITETIKINENHQWYEPRFEDILSYNNESLKSL